MQRGRLIAAGLFVLVCGSYVGAAKVGINLDVAHGVITPVWAPSGIALAVSLILGMRYWPAVAAGAFIANVTSDASVAVAAGIAIGNTLEPVVGAAIVRRAAPSAARPRTDGGRAHGRRRGLQHGDCGHERRHRADVGRERQDSFLDAWVLWWFGDAASSWWRPPARPLRLARRSASALGRWPRASLSSQPSRRSARSSSSEEPGATPTFSFRCSSGSPALHAAGAAAASFIVGAIGTWGAIAGEIPIGADTPTERVQVAQALFALVAVSLLVVGATLAEREAGSAELARTAALLGEAQALAHIGHWAWDIRRDVVTWSDELYRIFGLSPSGERKSTTPPTSSACTQRIASSPIERSNEPSRNGVRSLEHRVVRRTASSESWPAARTRDR